MQHYRMIEGKYVLHELGDGLKSRVVRAREADGMSDQEAYQKGYITAHGQIAIAYYVDTKQVATHGSPEGMALWAKIHNGHSPYKVEILTLPKGHPVDDINGLIQKGDGIQRLIGAPILK